MCGSLSTGNTLTCDCRLSWLYKLRNETRSKRFKAALDRLTCTLDSANQNNDVGVQSKTATDTKAMNNHVIKQMTNKEDKAYDEGEEDFADDRVYDEAMQDQETDSGKVNVEFRKKLMDIPNEALPCPRSHIHSEESYSPPSQDEIRSFETSSSERVIISPTIAIFSLVVMML